MRRRRGSWCRLLALTPWLVSLVSGPTATAEAAKAIADSSRESAAATQERVDATQAMAQPQAAAGASEPGRRIYNYRCYYCHGYSGDARTLAAQFMDPPPRDFTALEPGQLSRERMLAAVREGVPGTAMQSFGYFLDDQQMAQVVDFVREEFMRRGRSNTRYHTAANGWPNHERYAAAFPFARGEIPLDAPQESLSATERRGLRLYLTTCISCHDRAATRAPEPIWELRAISYPRNNFSFTDFDGVTSASVYAEHDRPPEVADLGPLERQGEQLFQENCAFCHAADGTGRNWIGSFLDAKPRNLRASDFMTSMTAERLRTRIEEGVPGTSMPAWKSVLDSQQIEALVRYIDRVFHPLADGPQARTPAAAVAPDS